MSDVSSETHSATVSISLNMGRTSVHIGTYALADVDAAAKAAVIDQVVKRVLADWPNTNFLGEICSNPKKQREW